MRRLRPRLAHALRQRDAMLLGGLGLLALAAALHWGAAAQMRADIESLRQDTGAAQRELQVGSRERQRQESLAPAARLDAFYRNFPLQETAPDWLQKVHEAADKQGLQLPMGDYRLAREPGSRLLAYQVRYPLKGSYAQLRRFVAQVLHEVPVASLDEMSFRRDGIGQGEVQATMRLTLYLKEAP